MARVSIKPAILFFCFLSIISIDDFSNGVGPIITMEKMKEKQTQLHFYFHDIVRGTSVTAVRIAEAQSTSTSKTMFGSLMAIDNALTEGPELKSKFVGRAQGMYGYISQSEVGLGLLMVMNFVFMEGKNNGCTLSILGKNTALSKVREMPIVGGSGVFRFATGYALARTHFIDQTMATVEYNVFVKL